MTAGLAVLLAGSCGKAPEEDSGPDAHRNAAVEMKFGEWDNGDVNPDGDRTDWKFVQVPSAGTYRILFHAVAEDIAARIAVFDRYGRPIAAGTRAAGHKKVIDFLLQTPDAGKHFVMVQATSGPRSDYSVKVTGKDGSGGSDVPRPEW